MHENICDVVAPTHYFFLFPRNFQYLWNLKLAESSCYVYDLFKNKLKVINAPGNVCSSPKKALKSHV
jgi:hypothetical protein